MNSASAARVHSAEMDYFGEVGGKLTPPSRLRWVYHEARSVNGPGGQAHIDWITRRPGRSTGQEAARWGL
jgi:hypothetical protein